MIDAVVVADDDDSCCCCSFVLYPLTIVLFEGPSHTQSLELLTTTSVVVVVSLTYSAGTAGVQVKSNALLRIRLPIKNVFLDGLADNTKVNPTVLKAFEYKAKSLSSSS